MDSTSAQPAVSPADLLGHHAFLAMNTHILLLSRSWDSAKLLCEAEQVFLDVEERFSRFRSSSELSVSAIAPSGVEADVFAKVALLLGSEKGKRFIDAQGAHGPSALAWLSSTARPSSPPAST